MIFLIKTLFIACLISVYVWGMEQKSSCTKKINIVIISEEQNTILNKELIRKVIKSDIGAVKILLDAGADVNVAYKITYPDRSHSCYNTVLHEAVGANNKAMVELLLAQPCIKVNAVSITLYKQSVLDSFAPLHAAVLSGNADVVQLLCQAKADVNAAYNTTKVQGCTALYDAIIQNRLDIVKTLLLHGACVNKKNSSGKSAIDIAVTQSYAIYYMLMEANKPTYDEVMSY